MRFWLAKIRFGRSFTRRTFSAVVNAGSIAHESTSKSQIQLRPYQETCLATCLNALDTGASRIGVSLPTGSGKTTVFISLLSRLQPPALNPHATQSMIIVNSVELARQSAEQARRIVPSARIEIEQGAKHKASGFADITVATYQTLLQSDRLLKFNPSTMKAIIVDEAHHAAAPSYRRILSHFTPDIESPDSNQPKPNVEHKIPIVGFSATFSRHDGLALGSVFEKIVYHRDFLQMIQEKWLCNLRFTSVKAEIDFRNVTISSATGDFNPTSLAHVINTDQLNDLVVKTWLDRATQRKSTLVFCVNLAHVAALTQAFRAAGVDARYIHSGTPAADRHVLLSTFREGQYPVLINCAVLTEGADIPNIDCVVVSRPTRSQNVFAQMIGRGMRLSPQTGKDDCHIIDFVDSTARVRGVVTVPSLLGLSPLDDVEDVTLEELKDRQQAEPHADSYNVPSPKSVTYKDYEDPFSLFAGASGAPNIFHMSGNAWVGCGGDVYVLECLGKGHVRIEPDMNNQDESTSYFRAHFTPVTMDRATAFRLGVSPFRKSQEFLTASTLNEAIRGADTYVAKKILPGALASGIFRSARWRKEPATENQQKWLVTRRGLKGTEAKHFSASLTKGDAANMITRIKHGAQKRFTKKLSQQDKIDRKAEKEIDRVARLRVAVGPLKSPM